ncbi:hypothetical protein NLJ89_g10482 [Agrocybe chaxingu]|uniref:Alanine dehydrogenase/pyridine nucleotide transhydrogenase N-terminal domain-containing protein n=1 Tax=Agrocybe chaxingu TaxID=84603 RepID=A0A9W8MNW5_9AGAR|nr:hypothetical protein NLJ89_g10482 [Agrocybe chaxingu]
MSSFRRGPAMASLKLSRLGRPLVIGIRREDPGRIWERRAPITPDDVHEIVSREKAAVEVVACARRVFSDYEYKQAGARIVSRLSPDVDLVVGIKEPPLREVVNLEQGRQEAGHEPQTFLMFSHTHKGQPYNTKLLSRFAAQTHERAPREFNPYPRLIDYELITKEDTGKRTVGFGVYAGLAGVLEGFSSMAHAHLKAGIASPFLYTPRPHTLPTLEHLRSAFRSVGKMIEKNGTPPGLGPVIVGVTGNGQVAKGCLSMLQELPIKFVKPSQLESLVKNRPSHSDFTKIYVCHAQPEDYFRRTDGRSYDRADYYLNPDMYESVFYHKIAPYLTLLFHGAGWSPSFPRLMTKSELIFALEKAARISPHHQKRFTNIADISCDIEGGLEFLTATTTLSSPSYEYRPTPTDSNPTPFLFSPHVEPPVVTMMAVDILPAAIPRDASYHFSQVLRPYILSLIERMREEKAVWEEQGNGAYAKAIAQFANPDSEVRENGNGKREREDPYKSALSRAIIASGGELVGHHTWLQQSVDKVLEERTFRVDPDLVPKPSDGVGEELWAMLAEPQESQRRNVSKKEAVVANDIEEAVTKKASREAASESDDSMEKLSKVLNDIEPSVASSSPATDTGSGAPLGKKKILMFGSGMVAGPAVDYLAQRKDVELVIGSNCLAELQQLSAPYKHVQYRMIDFEKQATYKHLVAETDVVISLLPAAMHPAVAKLCIEMGKHLVTASYVSDAMAELDEEAKSKGVLLLNEIGLDPGIDHLSAQDMIDRIHKDEKSIISFTSFCGGLPALEDSFVPLRYKFSWRPQGVLTAALNTAKYRLDGVDHRVSGDKLLSSPFHNLPITPEFELEGLPNRYSLPYITAYHIRYPVPTFVRGTLRHASSIS